MDQNTEKFEEWLAAAEAFVSRLPQGISEHCRRVSAIGAELAGRHGADLRLAKLGGLLHDIARGESGADMLKRCEEWNIPVGQVEASHPVLLHGVVGAETARRELGITHQELLTAITWHSTGREAMTPLEKVVFLADKLDPGKEGYYPPGLEQLPELAKSSLDDALLLYWDWLLLHLIQRKAPIHTATVDARNYLIQRSKAREE